MATEHTGLRSAVSGPNPYGAVSLTEKPLKTQQKYDLGVTISVPRSPPNVERGNFMVKLLLLDKSLSDLVAKTTGVFAFEDAEPDNESVVFRSRRPALIPYNDPVVSLVSRTVFSLYHLLFPASQVCKMSIPLAERVEFPSGASIPSSAYLEIEAGQTIQIYSVSLTIIAQLRGLRWLMVHYRLLMYLAFTGLFWLCELFFMILAWGLWSGFGGSISGGVDREWPAAIEEKSSELKSLPEKYEDDEDEGVNDSRDLSDRPYSFPTYGGQPPLKHEPRVKREPTLERSLSEVPVGGAEADDEDDGIEEARSDRWRGDSGIGTSYSEGGSSTTRRRLSKRDLR
ncbi:hypothetical protein S7711_06072 [Stachybotrys chartarum IBT 7711]|uniref:Seipin n=1 Tax=Stachybotrys chartarum (strain CBS 109288 / IBT 7711) TaxID=1280523 RepID=A0A084B233_STACB|nr:hypothetical protein S7711_06072 [Stachybotrys chartarum IBT 7711]